ncbi:DUF3067 family protein [Gloeocapsa sp. PCC 73106]|uniref:DUF3067 family protein n=1 Tax=Gloeocapsa sp. PCC 73106 TaxID=102232 RepID=UPI0002ABA395|nr:DUF3067 family protein [Gloeocapsa sp. PCC 73106]ELR99667.1 Protein of unknown function (DUF3067) [Gloeocapsa sp. PCC 73106]
MTSEQLQQLLVDKWGYSYDIQLRRVKGKIFLQVMWKYLEQVSFPMSEMEYLDHLNGILAYLNAWGSLSQVVCYIENTKERPRLGKAVSIPLDLGEKTSEWILD